MAVVIQADPAVAGFNSYSTLAAATSYHESRLHNAAWTGATDPTKNSALVWATRQLDSLNWIGVRTSGTQLLAFPRRGLSYYESSDIGGFDYERIDVEGMGYLTKIEISDTTVPTFLQQACSELAFWLISSDTTAPTGLEGIKHVKVDSIEVEALPQDRQSWFNDAVRDLVWRFLKNSSKYSAPTRRV